MFTKAKLLGIGLVVLSVFSLAGSVAAQGGTSTRTLRALQEVEIPVRNAPSLAERLGGLIGASSLTVDPAPDYRVGDVEAFFVGHSDRDEIFEVEAELAAAAPGVYLWVQVGVDYDPEVLRQVAAFLDQRLFPAVRALYGQEASPGIDGDPHIYVLNVTNIGSTIGGYFNDNSVYPQEIFATSNEHEMFVIAVDNVPFNTAAYPYVLAHEFVHMIQHNEDENEQTWVTEGTAELGAFLTVGTRLSAVDLYLSNPTLQLNSWDIDNPSPYYGASALFFSYMVERFGPEFVRIHSQEPADGINGVNKALATLGATDALTGKPIAFADIFADWLVTNLVNDRSLADGRFGYERLDLGSDRAALTGRITAFPAIVQDRAVNQFGANYYRIESDTPRTLALNFEGSPQVQVVPTEARSGSHVYWANRSDQSNPRLTRAFDLRAVSRATLEFDTWYEMEPFWDYGYVSISTDNGASWQILENGSTVSENPNNRAFAPGFTGYSVGGVAARPAPYLGLQFDPTSGTVLGLVPGSGAASAGVQPGDKLVAVDSTTLDDPSNLITLLNSYDANDTVIFTILREGTALDLPVTLGAHPDRTIRPRAAWASEAIDLTPYAGHEVLIRFEYVTDQAFTRNGWVLDDIRIPELGYADNAEQASDWTSEGWVRIANELPQDYLVEIVAGPDSEVTRLLMPGDGQTGTWTVNVGPDSPATVIISGMTRYTTQPGIYTLRVDALD